jgi:Polysaccharide lyase family 4, domain II
VKPDGTFQFEGVMDETYDVTVESSCESCYLKAVTVGAMDVLNKGLSVTSGVSISSLQIIYGGHVASVEGSVTDRNGAVSGGALILLAPDSPSQDRSDLYDWATADQYGRFVIENVVPGSYHAFAFQKSDDWFDYQNAEFLRPLESSSLAVPLSDGEKKHLELKLIDAPVEP